MITSDDDVLEIPEIIIIITILRIILRLCSSKCDTRFDCMCIDYLTLVT